MTINIQNNTFSDLVKSFPTWEQLKKYLESDEGGQFRIVDTLENGLCLIRYEKDVTNMDLPHSRWFRSVVRNTHINRPVSVAPPKTTSADFTFNSFKDVNEAGIVCQELLDGFMINCFKLVNDNTLYISSRSKLKATGKFYSSKSFRQLFIEAFMETVGSTNFSESAIQFESSWRAPDVTKNEVAVFYSFLVQHKEHRIVKKINVNRVFLIHSGVVLNDGQVNIEDGPAIYNEKPNLENLRLEKIKNSGTWAQVLTNVSDNVNEMNEVQEWIKNLFANRSWDFQGIVFKDVLGNRWRFRSEKYALVKSLRGNSPALRERFAQLYTQNLVYKYLEYYPEDVIYMTVQLMLANTIIKILYNAYVDLHITKTTKIELIDKMYHPHLYNLHGIYLSQLRPHGQKINITDVQVYFNKLPWQRIVFLIKKVNDQLDTVNV